MKCPECDSIDTQELIEDEEYNEVTDTVILEILHLCNNCSHQWFETIEE